MRLTESLLPSGNTAGLSQFPLSGCCSFQATWWHRCS